MPPKPRTSRARHTETTHSRRSRSTRRVAERPAGEVSDVYEEDEDERGAGPVKNNVRANGSMTRGMRKPAEAERRRNRGASARKYKSAREPSDEEPSESEDDAASDAYKEGSDGSENDAQELDSDALDEDEDDVPVKKGAQKRAQPRSPRKAASPRKRRKTGGESDEDDVGLKEGQEIVGRVVQAPKSGRVPPGQISQNTFDFLAELKKPECNDREWFKLHEPVFRLAENEFKAFIEKFTDSVTEVDSQLPPLPPKDVIYRIYRDVRFSNDKTPYKQNFSATFSRSGRKGIFAGYHLSIQPGGGSLIAAGTWCPGKNELATIRSHIQHSSVRLRRIISAQRFVEYFGEPKADLKGKGKRQNIFGSEDELKVAPKGIDKNHKDIDLLKCRSFVVVHHFEDEQVLSPDFIEIVLDALKAAKPLVYCLNDYMTVGVGEDNDDADEEGAEEGEGEDEERDE